MLDVLLADVTYGGYISIISLVIFVVCFFLWLLLVNWVYKDANAVGTDRVFWTGILLAAAVMAVIIWLIVPFFLIGVLFYVAAVAGVALAYVKHRNTKVMDFDRVLSADHLRNLFVNKAKKLDQLSDFMFITANNNEVPIPQPQTPDFFGYKTAYDIITDAILRRGSNIVFSPTHENYNVTYTVDGAAVNRPPIPRNQMEYLIHFVKNVAALDLKEKRKPQKGKFTTRKAKVNSDWEITTAGSTAGEHIQLKQLTKHDMARLPDIGLPPESYEQLNKIRDAKQGLFIVAGTPKSGVTTTFYSLVRNHDAFINSVNTVEKQPTLELPNITQNLFKLSDTGTSTYAKKVQTVTRMDPDVVGIADCTDAETAKIAAAAAKDGKIIYVTIQAENVVQSLGEWLKLIGSRDLVAETLLGISNQRLLRKLCDQCKQPYEPNKDILHKFNIPAEKAKVLYRIGKVIYDKRGRSSTCQACQGTGFVGRMAIFEIILIDSQLKQVIKRSTSLSDIATQFRRAKMLYLQEHALKKVIAGTTAVNEMVRVLAKSKNQKNNKRRKKSS